MMTLQIVGLFNVTNVKYDEKIHYKSFWWLSSGYTETMPLYNLFIWCIISDTASFLATS